MPPGVFASDSGPRVSNIKDLGEAGVHEPEHLSATMKRRVASGMAGLFAFVDRLATMTFPLAVRRPKNVIL